MLGYMVNYPRAAQEIDLEIFIYGLSGPHDVISYKNLMICKTPLDHTFTLQSNKRPLKPPK